MTLQAATEQDFAGCGQGGPVMAGSPRFADLRHAALVRNSGVEQAWRDALTAGPARAACGVGGDFAIGLQLPGGRSFAAVDRFAVRTLCFRVMKGELRFALRADDLIDESTPLDPQALYDYLYFHAIPSPRTVFKGVYRVPPGHYVWHEGGRLTVAPYWTPEFTSERSAPLGALCTEFRDLLRQAVRRQLDGSPPACFLSGGTDSSTVAGVLAEVMGEAPATYSIGFEAEGYDEMEYARLASRHFQTRHHEYYVTPDDLVRSIPVMAAHLEQPFGNSSVLPAHYCALQARQDGGGRLLAGDGGDELFGGNSRYATQRVLDAYQRLPAGLRHRVLEPFFSEGWGVRLPLLRKGAGYIRQARMPLPDRLQTYNLLLRLGPAKVLTDEFLARVDSQEPLQQQRRVWAGARADSALDRMLAYDWRYTLAESDLPKVRAATELAGVSVGFPLLDDDLLAFSLRLATDYKLRGLKLRWFFKEALRGFLPEQIITKKKHGFGLPFGVWLTRHTVLHDLAAASLQSLVRRNIVRADFLDALLRVHLPQHPGYYGEMVWILTMLEQWLQAHEARVAQKARRRHDPARAA